jgi:hypothetical protein
MTNDTTFRWDATAGLASLAAGVLCLVPTLGVLAAWHMQVDMAAFMRFAVLPTLVLLAACEFYLINRHPLLFNRLAAGLVGGLAATAAFDLIRLPATYVFHLAPDFVPVWGQLLLGEMVGVAPSTGAIALGYAISYLLVGTLVGAADSLTLGRSTWRLGLALGLAAGLAFTLLPQFGLLTVAMGFAIFPASASVTAASTLGGLVLGAVVQRLGRTRANVINIVFLRTEVTERDLLNR